MKVVAIVQARMGSSRLPGKILKEIVGKPMLWHVVNRLKACKFVHNIVVATTTSGSDNIVKEFCMKNSFEIFSGSENDVLDRYYQAAIVYGADAVVRITADCPLIDPSVSDRVISEYLNNQGEIDGSSNTINRTYPRGLDTEVFSFASLTNIWKEAKKDYQREHVTIYAYEHPKKFKLIGVENDIDLSNLRFTVDEEPDLLFIKNIYERLYSKKKIFLIEDVLQLINKEPNLIAINRHVKQKSI